MSGTILRNVCLVCGMRRAVSSNCCETCHRVKFGLSPNAVRRLLALGKDALPELAGRFEALMELPPDRPEVIAAALIVRAIELRTIAHTNQTNKNA